MPRVLALQGKTGKKRGRAGGREGKTKNKSRDTLEYILCPLGGGPAAST